jgi:PilZ domain
MPPATMDLATPVSCLSCGASSGSWRALEIAEAPAGKAERAGTARRPSSDLRSGSRARTLLGARIVFNNRHSTVDCTVRDLSAIGAKVLVSPHVPVPDEFDLHIPQKRRKHRARIMWRDAEACGVRFVE